MSNKILITLLPLLATLLSELIFRGNSQALYNWIVTYPDQFILNYTLLFGIINIFYFLPRRLYAFIGVFIVSLDVIAGFVSRQKVLLRGEPLLPWDFALGKEAFTITQSFDISTIPILPIIGCTLLIITILISLLSIPKEKYVISTKLVTALLSFALLFTVAFDLPLEKTFSLQLINWNQKANYEENGMLLGFVLNSKYLGLETPENYQEETIAQIIDNIDSSYPVDPNFKPNIIFVMSEAFWDPTLLKEVKYSEDPIPYFHSLQKNSTSGTMLSPVYGGGTANTEFEILTGLSTQFLPGGTIPYVQFVHKPVEALPSILKKQGYETTAIHTYDNWFYRRNIVYEQLGFDRFISKEFFDNPELNGSYIRDTELSKKILQTVKGSPERDFIYAISMEAHGPYSNEEKETNTIDVAGDLTPETKNILKNYTNIVSDVDQSLKLLIENLQKFNEPTIVVFYGDHLPMLGNDFDVYKEANFFDNEETYEDYQNKYTVPFVVWDNFSHKKEDLRLSANFLGSYILELSKNEGGLVTDFLTKLRNKGTDLLTVARYRDQEKLQAEDLKKYQALQYDILNGNEYAYALSPDHKPADNPFYVVGDSPAVIENVLLPDQETLEVLGANFSPNHQIFIGDKPITTEFISNTALKATVPLTYLKNLNSLEIQVKLTDSMKNIISESNVYSNAEDEADANSGRS